jgi:hypothetical protein
MVGPGMADSPKSSNKYLMIMGSMVFNACMLGFVNRGLANPEQVKVKTKVVNSRVNATQHMARGVENLSTSQPP